MRSRDWEYLFSEYDLRAILDNQVRSINDKVIAISKERFRTDSDEQISAAIASDLVVEPLTLDEDEISVESDDVKVDVSRDFNRAVFDRSQPAYVDGVEVGYHVPFLGDKELLKCRGSEYTMNPPRAVIGNGELIYRYQVPGREVGSTKTQFQQDLRTLKEWLPWINGPIAEYNSKLEDQVRQRVAQRRSELEKTSSDLDALGFKVRTSSRVQTQSASTPEPVETRRKRSRAKAAREYDVALSFAGEDREFVAQVAERLKDLGVSVFYDDFETVDLWGKDLAAHLADIYGKRSRFVVIFASQNYAAKAWPNHERAAALARQFTGERDRVLPVRFDHTEIPGMPATIGYLDLRALTPTKLAELIRQKVDSEEK